MVAKRKLEKNKIIILELKKIFEEMTDEDNEKDLDQLHEMLLDVIEEKYPELYADEIKRDSKTMKTYIKTFNEIGFEIIELSGMRRFNKKAYYHRDKFFEDEELMMIINALNSFKFLSEEQTDEIKKKIRVISRKNTFEKFEQVIKLDPKLKVKNNMVIFNIKDIADALLSHRELKFKYNEYKIVERKIREIPRNNNKTYKTKPYGVALNSGKMYLVARDIDENKVKNFRIELMDQIEGGEYIADNEENFNLNEYLEKSLSMFGGEKEIILKLKVKESYIANIMDYLGQDLFVEEYLDDSIIISHKLYDNGGLVSILMRFGDNIEVLEPESLKDKLRKRAQKILELYK